MSFNVDIDEADVAVLNQNLIKSKELFTSISRSLNKISTKSSTASIKIKPILKDVNKLNENRNQLDSGLSLLSEVSNYASETSKYESVLNNSIELIGLKKFIDTLARSKILLKEMKSNIKRFKGILINFENLIDKSELNLENYFQKVLKSNDLGTNKLNEIILIFQYFYSSSMNGQSTIDKIFMRSQSMKLVETIRPHEEPTKPIKRNSNIPYEKGSNGINRYNNEMIKAIKAEIGLLNDVGSKINLSASAKDMFMLDIVRRAINESYAEVIANFNKFLRQSKVLNNDLLILETIENLNHFEKFLNVNNIDVRSFPAFNENYHQLINISSDIFRELIEYSENRVKSVEKLTDLNATETVVELISRIRKLSEYNISLLKLINGMKLGSWLNLKPPVRFISVYTSVIPNISDDIDETAPEHLLSCFISDYIDSIIINIEIGLKSDVSLKKSMQGYYLIKNTILIETIVNRSQQLFTSLGNLGIERLNRLKKRFLKLFLDDWNYASYIIIRDMTTITTTNAVSGHSGSGMSSKEKEQIKELFKNFNESFEDALRNYEKYNITDVNLRAYLSGEIKKLIMNAYFKLYDKYGSGEFTKNKAKYIKYNKHQFEQILSEKL
ncbi:Exocyst complex protein EXO70 [Debaryomyces fabryi]|uniref:Exocyst complex protein EXO70 n=1 Tax=Debaryomyces fabryi TaxID=58627 RepID=A0A0V1Q295_9ASCO|nr:Exocyst complex protein EXO70 [Debaryomyces fabryi]KSA02373.1 Exocyst complex protein EXO70 [Debaryomyces fabryi]CUM56549.1 unnamed protein product [Debaryomyces fabryi]